MIAHLVTDIKVLDRQTGEIFVLRPRFGTTAAGVNAGDEMFVNITDGTYASEQRLMSKEVMTDGSTTYTVKFDGTADNAGKSTLLRPGSVKVSFGGKIVARDDAHGSLVGKDWNGAAVTGTVTYDGTAAMTAGTVAIKFATAPANGVLVVEAYSDTEVGLTEINEVQFDVTAVPVTARAHPLKYAVSAQAQLIASAHLDIDVNDVLTNIAAGAIKQERDVSLVNMLFQSATHVAELDFDLDDATAAKMAYRTKRDRMADIILKVNEAQTQIQQMAGRGGVSYIVAGTHAANCFRCCEGFKDAPEAANAAIGPYKMGAVRDGTVPVICVPKSKVLGPNDFIIGFKGFQTGDSATVLAEWIPLYFTSLWQDPLLMNRRGLMSMYDMFVNRPEYIVRGEVKNYTA